MNSTAGIQGNGRINFSAPPSAGGLGTALTNQPNGFSGFSYQTSAEKNFQADMLRGNWESNVLSDSFFSRKNIQAIQSAIRKEVFVKSQPKGYIIDEQSVDELKIIMRAIYYQYARNLPNNIAGQVQDLNKRVIDWSVPHILSAVDHHFFYLKDIETLPTPISHPVNISRAGTKSMPQSPFM